ncbi:hypothetical protein EDD86DRAFT_244020 [Gorgonomyces haynaldii]|nr:hypothetical protein EDD86DRAFT_244020 [Gorgonomyces haynaldii]
MVFYKGITKLPLEVYPLIGMMSCAVGFGFYVAGKHISEDQHLRIRSNQGLDLEGWANRITTEIGITKLPLEVYPLIGMMSCAVGFGFYVAGKHISEDQHLRIRSNQGLDLEGWTTRIASDVADKIIQH